MIVVAIPAFNEELTVGSVLLKAKKYADRVLLIDDGSSDSTAEVAKLAGVRVITHKKNLGYGAALKACFKGAIEEKADILVILDADGQHDPDDIAKLIIPIKAGECDIVIGSRFLTDDSKANIPKYRRFGIKTLTLASRLGTDMEITDSQSGFRAYSKEALEKIEFFEDKMGAGSEILMDATEKGLKINEVPILCLYEGLKKGNDKPASHGLSVMNAILRKIKHKNPLLFFSIPGIIAVVLGLILGIFSLNIYYSNRVFAPGIVLLSMLFITLGIFTIFTGLILDSTAGYADRIILRMRDGITPDTSKRSRSLEKIRRSLKYRGFFRTLARAIQIKHPFIYLGFPGSVCILIGVIMGIWSVNIYYSIQEFAVGVVLLSMLLIIIGVLSIFTSFILDSLANLSR